MTTTAPEPLTEQELATCQRRHQEANEFGRGKVSLHAARLWAQEIGTDAHRDRRILLAHISALQSQVQDLTAQAAKEEAAHEQTITERDEAEEALSQAYYLIVGRSPEWSNLFGHEQALEEIKDAQSVLRQSLANATAREAVLVKQLLICADQFDYYANQHRAKSPPDSVKAETNTRYAEIARRAVASSFPSATALLEELKLLRANQRTPGTKEVCAECNDHSWRSSCKWSLYAPSDHVCKIVRAAKESPP